MKQLSEFNIVCLSLILDVDERLIKTTRGESKRRKRILKERKRMMSEITKDGFTEEYIEGLIAKLIEREKTDNNITEENVIH